ncbi:MAG: hypothetical protein ABIF82_08350 [Planctomycetota bacterium]
MAGTYVFQPGDRDMYDLDHCYAYEWGIEFDVPENEVVTGASIFFDNIRNWDTRSNDLYVTLLDSDFVGINKSYDNEGGGNYFATQGLLLEHYEDLSSSAQDITYHFDPYEIVQLKTNLADDLSGLGFDPDCHFYNCGITFTIETDEGGGSTVPEPLAGSILLGGVAMTAARRRRR